MKLRNLSQRAYMHILDGECIVLEAGAEKEIPDVVAELWKKSPDIVMGADESKDKEIAALKAELAKKNKDEAIREEGKALNIKGYATMNINKLSAKIAEIKTTLANAE